MWANSLGNSYVVTSDNTLSAAAVATGAIRVLINGVYYDLLYK